MYDTPPKQPPAIWDRVSASDLPEGSNSPFLALGMLPGFFVLLAVGVTSWTMFLSRDAADPAVMMALEAERMQAIATAAGGPAWISLPDPAPSPCGQSVASGKNGLPG